MTIKLLTMRRLWPFVAMLCITSPSWAGYSAIEITDATYPSSECEPPVLRHLESAPTSIDQSFEVYLDVVISTTGRGIVKNIRSRLPVNTSPVYLETYKAMASASVRYSTFDPATCNGHPVPIAAVIKFTYEVKAKLAPAKGCSDPKVVYKPPPPHVLGAQNAKLHVNIQIDETGRIENAVFDSYTVEDYPDRTRSILYAPGQPISLPANKAWVINSFHEYQLGVLENLMKWRFSPAVCDGKAMPKTAAVDFDFGYDHAHPTPPLAIKDR